MSNTVQWYPGHMVKAKEEMKKMASLVDAIIVLLDARAPYSSLNPDLNSLFGQKPIVFLLNKADLADPKETSLWEKALAHHSYSVYSIEALKKPPVDLITKKVREACSALIAKEKAKGMKDHPLKAMIVGIPNVGKSTLINRIAGKNVAKVANRPGVTTSAQWIRLNKDLYVLDMPGVLWPKFDDEKIGLHLGLIGSIKDQTNSASLLVPELLNIMTHKYPGYLKERYGITESDDHEAMLDELAATKGFNNPRDARQRTYNLLLADYRNSRLGRMTLDNIEDYR